jgi:hypothetical protein
MNTFSRFLIVRKLIFGNLCLQRLNSWKVEPTNILIAQATVSEGAIHARWLVTGWRHCPRCGGGGNCRLSEGSRRRQSVSLLHRPRIEPFLNNLKVFVRCAHVPVHTSLRASVVFHARANETVPAASFYHCHIASKQN